MQLMHCSMASAPGLMVWNWRLMLCRLLLACFLSLVLCLDLGYSEFSPEVRLVVEQWTVGHWCRAGMQSLQKKSTFVSCLQWFLR